MCIYWLNVHHYKFAIILAFCIVFFNMQARKIYVNSSASYIYSKPSKMYLQCSQCLLRRFNLICESGICDRLDRILHALSVLCEITRCEDRIDHCEKSLLLTLEIYLPARSASYVRLRNHKSCKTQHFQAVLIRTRNSRYIPDTLIWRTSFLFSYIILF